jgi:hypothetical protein
LACALDLARDQMVLGRPSTAAPKVILLIWAFTILDA